MKATAIYVVVPVAFAYSSPPPTVDPSETDMFAEAHALFAAWHRAGVTAVFGDAAPAFETFNGRADRVDSRVTILVRFGARRD